MAKVVRDGDFVEKSVYDEMKSVHVSDGDILLSSTEDGTLGKCAVYREGVPGIFDGHVTLIRVDEDAVHPEYLCDFLRAGFGSNQIARLFTGSTGLIELPPEQVDEILVALPDKATQIALSANLREAEQKFSASIEDAGLKLRSASAVFRTDSAAS